MLVRPARKPARSVAQAPDRNRVRKIPKRRIGATVTSETLIMIVARGSWFGGIQDAGSTNGVTSPSSHPPKQPRLTLPLLTRRRLGQNEAVVGARWDT